MEHDQSNGNYDVGNKVIYNTEVLESNLLNIITTAHNNPTSVAFRNCAPFIKCTTKIDGSTIDDAEKLGFVMPMYNLTECSSDYFDATGSLWFYSEDGATNFNADVADGNNFKSFS